VVIFSREISLPQKALQWNWLASLPYDFASIQCQWSINWLNKYSGLEVDHIRFSMGRELCSHIKGVNWYKYVLKAKDLTVGVLGGEEDRSPSVCRNTPTSSGIKCMTMA